MTDIHSCKTATYTCSVCGVSMQMEQPEQEFIKHHGDDEGWSEWVCPDPDDYLISCCDCGLVHQAQFRVAKYAPAPSEECEIVNDPDLQAQFRMRRHAVTKPQPDNWTPEDTAHRVGGLAQPEQEPGTLRIDRLNQWLDASLKDRKPAREQPAQRKPLTPAQAIALWADKSDGPSNSEIVAFARAIEAAHGIKGEA